MLVIPGGFSSADWSVRHHVGAPNTSTTTVSAAGNSSSAVSITTTGGGDYVCDAAFESMGFATDDGGGGGGGGGGGTIPESTVGLISKQRRSLLNRVLDNRDLCRIVSSFIPGRNYRS